MTQQTIIQNIRPLTESERLDARQVARQNVVKALGPQPTRSQFAHHTASKYPAWLNALIVGLCLIALLAAFTPSAIRLYHIGSETFGQSIADYASTQLVGVATVLLAETGQVVFSLALAVLGASAASRRLLYTSMGISTLIALVGNVQIALPGYWSNPFSWLEAIAPPVLVLSTAYVLKGLLLEAIERRHANERAYQESLAAWKLAADNPEDSAAWMQAYANAIRDTLRSKNNRYKTGRESLPALTAADWRALVYRELASDSWYMPPADDAPYEPSSSKSTANGHGDVSQDFLSTQTAPVIAAASGHENGAAYSSLSGKETR